MYICCCCFGRSLFFSSENCVFLHQSTLLIHFATITSKTWALNFSWGKNYIVKYLPDVHCHCWWKKKVEAEGVLPKVAKDACKRNWKIVFFFTRWKCYSIIWIYLLYCLERYGLFSKVILWFCGWPPLMRKRKSQTLYEHVVAKKLKKWGFNISL